MWQVFYLRCPLFVAPVLFVLKILAFGNVVALAVDPDAAALADLRRQVESLPEDKRLIVGTELVRAHLDKFQTKAMRLRVLASLGDLYAKQGQDEDSEKYYREVIKADPDSELALYSKLRIEEMLIKSGRRSEAGNVVGDVDPIRRSGNKAWLDDNVVSAKVLAHVEKEQYEEALKLCTNLCSQLPTSCQQMVVFAQFIPKALSRRNEHEVAIKWMDRIERAIASAHHYSEFRSNQIVMLSYCEPNCDKRQTERLQQAIEAFVKEFPENKGIASFLASFADNCMRRGDRDLAIQYYKKALSHKTVSARERTAITDVLATIDESEQQKKAWGEGERTATAPFVRFLLIATNILVFVLGFFWFKVRRVRRNNVTS